VCVCVREQDTFSKMAATPFPPDLARLAHTQLFYRLQHSRVTSTVVLLTNAMRMHIFACLKIYILFKSLVSVKHLLNE